MAHDQQLTERVRQILAGQGPFVEKVMFGGVGFMLQGNMACGLNRGDLIVRVGPAGYEEALAEPHTRPFDMTGRPMRGWVVVQPAGYAADRDLTQWVQRGVDFALSLPPK